MGLLVLPYLQRKPQFSGIQRTACPFEEADGEEERRNSIIFFFFLNSSKNNKITALKLSSQAERSLLFSSHNICVFVKCLNMESY